MKDDLPFDYLENVTKELTFDEVVKELRNCRLHMDFLAYIKNTIGLCILNDNGVYWLEYLGKEIPGSRKRRFTTPGEIDDLIIIAGL